MKPIIASLVALLIAPLLFAADAADKGTGVPNPLRIGSEGAYPPFSFIDESGPTQGLRHRYRTGAL